MVDFSLIGSGEWSDSIWVASGASNLFIILLLIDDHLVNLLEQIFNLARVLGQVLVNGVVALGTSIHFLEYLQVGLEFLGHNKTVQVSAVDQCVNIVVSVNFSHLLLQVKESLLDVLLLVGDEKLDAGSQVFDLLREEPGEVWSIWRWDSDVLWLNWGNLGRNWLDEVQFRWLWNLALVDLVDLLSSWVHQWFNILLESIGQCVSPWELVILLHLLNQGLSLQHVSILDADETLGFLSFMLNSS